MMDHEWGSIVMLLFISNTALPEICQIISCISVSAFLIVYSMIPKPERESRSKGV